MPERTFDLAPDTQVFADDNPLRVHIPDETGTLKPFVCKDRCGFKQIDPSQHQVTWFVEELTHQVVDEEQTEFRRLLVDGVETGRIPETDKDGNNTLAEMLRWLRETREAAERGTLARSVGRGNTKARPRSSPS